MHPVMVPNNNNNSYIHHNGSVKMDDVIQRHSPMTSLDPVKMEMTSSLSRGQLINPLTAMNKDITVDYVTREMAEKGEYRKLWLIRTNYFLPSITRAKTLCNLLRMVLAYIL